MTEPVPRACVIGWPARHSRSPLIHRHWLDTFGLAGAYEIEAIAPDDVEDFLRDLSGRGYIGCNVTLPHKETAARTVDSLDETAANLGAVNTVWYEAGALTGANTDVYGFLANLDAAVSGWDARLDRAVVLGAGGAARAVVHGLVARGVGRIDIVNRSVDRAEALCAGVPNATPHAWDDIRDVLENARFLVNTTSLGMHGRPPLDIDLSALAGDAVVNDIVYVPLETNLLKQARSRGLVAVDGLGMLLYQAVPGFEKWFGRRPGVTEDLRARLVSDIEAALCS